MKRKSLVQLCAFLIAGAISIFFLTSGINYSSGTYGGYSGSPGDNNYTCAFCHGGNPVLKENWIDTDIPTSGYTPGETYTITLSGTHTGVQKFGFEASAEDDSKTKKGKWIITNSAETKIVVDNSAVTHTFEGIAASDNGKSWSFDWTAPSQGTGNVTFYAALLGLNKSGTGDPTSVYKTSYSVFENTSSSITDNYTSQAKVNIYPVPARDNLIIEIDDSVIPERILIFDNEGRFVKSLKCESSGKKLNIDISGFKRGSYLVRIISDTKLYYSRFIAI